MKVLISGGSSGLGAATVREVLAAGGTPRYERPPPQTADEVIERAMESAV